MMSTQSMLLLVFLSAVAINNGFYSGNSNALLCIKSEREALLKFKQDVTDPSSRLASWGPAGEGDCCKWVGVVCSNTTGRVQELHLRNPHSQPHYETLSEYEAYLKSMLGGKINPSLINLKHLIYLDLGYNNFTGMVPSQLGNFSALQYLSIGGFYHQSLYVETLQWLSSLSLLRHLELSHVNLSRASDWLQVTSMLPSLVELSLSFCQLLHFPSQPIANFTNLLVLDLSGNNFDSSIPDWLCSLNGLETLSLGDCSLHGTIPSGLQNMTRLRDLDLCSNFFNSTIPDSLYSFGHLVHLDLGYNSLQGSISSAIGNLTSVITLDLSYNELKGKMPTSFANLCNLREIYLSRVSFGGDLTEILEILSKCILDGLEVLELGGSRLSGHVPDVIEQLGQSNTLTTLNLYNNSLSGPFPVSIARLSSIRNLYLHANELTGTLPECLGQLASLEAFVISQNSLQGVVSEVHFANLTRLRYFVANGNNLTFTVSPDWVPSFQVIFLFLSYCQLGPQFPMWLHSQKNLKYLDISGAGISDKIPSWFWNLAPEFRYLNLSHNHIQAEIAYIPSIYGVDKVVDLGSNGFTGPLPSISSDVTELYLSRNSFSGSLSFFLCYRMDEAKNLRTLDLEGNLLSGEIPDCWMNWPRLEFVNLENNHLTGQVPSSMRFLSLLRSLHLRDNNLSGGFPLSLQNCTELLIIDLGENQFSGNIPGWIGERLSKLKVLILQSNKFHGRIPIEICQLRFLQIMVFAHNNLFGTIPRCFNNISAMVIKQNLDGIIFMSSITSFHFILDNAILVMKGKEAEYSTILPLVTLLDLSDNNLSGEIPKELTNLVGLLSLNLSSNFLTGKIPLEVGSMISLESLDFSANQLSGEIPSSLSSLTFLSHLNLSYNNLRGKIPSSTQILSLDASSFIGNKLCGPPLAKNCPVIDGHVIPNVGNEGCGKDGDGLQVEWFYVSMGLGFVVGFWGVFGPVLFNRSCRFSYFQFFDSMWFKFCSVITKCC